MRYESGACKEFVAIKTNPTGVLILSENGWSLQRICRCCLVNPNASTKGVIDAIIIFAKYENAAEQIGSNGEHAGKS